MTTNCEITLQDNTSIAGTNIDSVDDLDKFQDVATDIAKRQADSMCTAYNNAITSNWFYRILAESGRYPIFNNPNVNLDTLPPEIIAALIESEGKVDAETLDKVCTTLFGKDNFSFYSENTGELTIEIVPVTENTNLVFLDGNGGFDNAVFLDGSNWIAIEDGQITLPEYEYFLTRFFTTFGVKVLVKKIPPEYASQFLYKGSFNFDYQLSELTKDANNNLYICDDLGNVYKSENFGANWLKVIDNTTTTAFKKCVVLSNGTLERLVVFGGLEAIVYNLDDYSVLSTNTDIYFNTECGFVKMSDSIAYFYGGNSDAMVTPLTDDLYKMQLNSDDSLTAELSLSAATGTARQFATLTKISSDNFVLTYSYDNSNNLLIDSYIFNVFSDPIEVTAIALTLNSYSNAAVWFRKDFIYIVGGYDETNTQNNRNCERIPIDFSVIENVTNDIGYDMLKCAAIEFAEIDTVRILTDDSTNKIVYGV
jgi:hypothetical protein